MLRVLLWFLAVALVACVAALAWAVTIAGEGWYLPAVAVFFCLPLPLWYFLTGRRH
ncbi:hypothetical protein [Streptomyces sp. NPDC048309]|uniref:hypothetical protein n=1 Tax=unclassified Streptomyces TaxID=2593676 RepID=UPI0033DEF054